MINVRIIVAGSRDFDDYPKLAYELECAVKAISSNPTVVSGGARGADRLGEQFAEEYEYPCRQFIPDWDGLGKTAGFVRNVEMADYADMLVAFWDGKSKGTKHMIDTAIHRGLFVKVIRV